MKIKYVELYCDIAQGQSTSQGCGALILRWYFPKDLVVFVEDVEA
jgi:hypothetical protein